MRKSVCTALSMEYRNDLYKKKPLYEILKKIFDFSLSLCAIVLLAPLFLIVSLLVKCTSKGPIFYGHKRIGKDGRYFKVYKFRSMVMDSRPLEEVLTPEQLDEYKRDYKITNDPRVTKIGNILRKTSIDELPQLFNILKGEMSIVGWRPILKEELDKYGELSSLLLKVKPGLTGFWASHGRSDTTYDDRIKMELYYCVKRSFLLDLRIVWHTCFGVFIGKGAK